MPLGPPSWRVTPRGLGEAALIIALLVELPLGIKDLVGPLEQAPLCGIPNGTFTTTKTNTRAIVTIASSFYWGSPPDLDRLVGSLLQVYQGSRPKHMCSPTHWHYPF